MSLRFQNFMVFILHWEGETFENDPDDPGGATKFGIDQRSHPGVDIRNLTRDKALGIYWDEYWTKMRCEELPAKVGEIVMNIGVNAGKSRAGRWLQHIIGAKEDGVIGPITVRMANETTVFMTAALLKRTEDHYRSIGKGRMAKFLKGWINRNNALREFLGLP